MPTIGYCHDCNAWVRVDTAWNCPNGHPAARVNGWHDSETGEPAVRDAASSPASGAPAGGTRDAVLTDLMGALSENRAYTPAWGPDTDMTISSNPVDPSWGGGHKRAEYAAALKVGEAERTVYFWESLKERGSSLPSGVLAAEAPAGLGATPSGARQEAPIGPGSTSWEWGYGTLRRLVEDVAARHGFIVRVVLTRAAAAW
jgi:hypothetical protein